MGKKKYLKQISSFNRLIKEHRSKKDEKEVIMATSVSTKIENTLKVMLNELKDECLTYIKLTNQLELDNLSEEQIEELLGELTASVTHLNTQSDNIKEEIEQ